MKTVKANNKNLKEGVHFLYWGCWYKVLKVSTNSVVCLREYDEKDFVFTADKAVEIY